MRLRRAGALRGVGARSTIGDAEALWLGPSAAQGSTTMIASLASRAGCRNGRFGRGAGLLAPAGDCLGDPKVWQSIESHAADAGRVAVTVERDDGESVSRSRPGGKDSAEPVEGIEQRESDEEGQERLAHLQKRPDDCGAPEKDQPRHA
jgi:hypothetical protein